MQKRMRIFANILNVILKQVYFLFLTFFIWLISYLHKILVIAFNKIELDLFQNDYSLFFILINNVSISLATT